MYKQHWRDYKISLSVCEWVCHTKRVERSTGRNRPSNLPPW